MKKSVDIDALLGEDKLELVLGGKVYEIDDVDLSIFMMSSVGDEAKEDILHEQLATILKVKKSALKGVGIRASAFALKAIRKWVTETGFEEVEEESSTKNP